MKRTTNHATDRASSRTGNRSEYDIDPDLRMKPSAFSTGVKTSYAGNNRGRKHEGNGYRRWCPKANWGRGGWVTGREKASAKRWQTLAMNNQHHRQLTKRAEKQARKSASKSKKRRRRVKKW